MLRKRTLGLIGLIDRNIRIGFIAFIVLSLCFILDDFVLSPLLSEGTEIPPWIILIDGLSVLLILGTFTYFCMSYYRAKQNYSQSNDLRHVLKSIICILNTYRRLFHWALGILLLVLCVAFLTGLFMGVETAAFRQRIAIEDLDQSQLIRQMAGGMILLIVLVSILFFFFRWGFRKLYGRYITQLEETLNELEEVD
jgi:heme/copper-type cytochrome/quinol oxidase subunit 2